MYTNRLFLHLVLVFLVAAVAVPGLAQNESPLQNGSETQPAEQEPPAPPTPPTPVDERFNSPRSTMFTYMDAMASVRDEALSPREKAEARELAMQCFDWGPSGEPNFNNASTLLEVLNKINRVERYQLPSKTDANARTLGSFTYFPQKRLDRHERIRQEARGGKIVLIKTDSGEWKFSTETIADVQTLRQALERLPYVDGNGPIILTRAQWVRSRVPVELKSGEVLTLEYWQWLGLLILIFVGIVLDSAVRKIIAGIWRHVMARRGKEADRALLRRAVRPFGLIVAAFLWYWGLDLIGLPPQALAIIRLAVRFFLMISAVWAACRATDLLAEFLQSKAELTATKFDDLLVPLVRKTTKVFIVALGLIYIANAMRIEILPLLTGLGIGGLAFAFAAKDTIENFFGSVAVMLDRSFEVGDWIVIDDIEGTVEELGFRSTRIRTFYNSLVTVPNATLVRAKVDNYGRRRYRRFKTHIGITYDTTPDQIEAFCEGIREIIRQHPYTRKDYFHIWLNQFGPSSLDILIYMFHEAPDWATELRERQRFMLDIMRLADRLGIEFAFPTQTLHIASGIGGAGVSPANSGAGVSPANSGAGVSPANSGAGVSPASAPSEHPPTSPLPDRLAEQRARVMGRRAARELLAHTSWTDDQPPPPVSFGKDAIPDDLPIPAEESDREPESIEKPADRDS